MRFPAWAVVVGLAACGGGDDAPGGAADASVADAAAADAAASDAPAADAAAADAAGPPTPHIDWAVRFGGADTQNPLAVAVGPSGDVYVAGFSLGAFDAGDVHLAYAGGNGDGFVMRLARDDGHVVWARPFGGSGQDWVRGLAVAPDGDVLILAQFDGTVDLGSGPVASTSRFLIAKLSADDGTARWARAPGTAGYVGTGHLAVHTDGSFCMSGDLLDATDFGDGPIEGAQDPAGLVVCFADDGAYRWARFVDQPIPGAAMGLALTSGGDPVTSMASNLGGHAFVGALGATDGAPRWSSALTATTGLQLWAVTTDAHDRVYAGGGLTGDLDFAGGMHSTPGAPVVLVYDTDGSERALLDLGGGEPGSITALTTAPDGTVVAAGGVVPGGALVAGIAPDGAVTWSRRFDGAGATAVAVDADGVIVLAGSVDAVAHFDGTTLTSAGESDVFVARLLP